MLAVVGTRDVQALEADPVDLVLDFVAGEVGIESVKVIKQGGLLLQFPDGIDPKAVGASNHATDDARAYPDAAHLVTRFTGDRRFPLVAPVPPDDPARHLSVVSDDEDHLAYIGA